MILLDTHALIWGLREVHQLSAAARDIMASRRQKAVSAASLYEIAYKGGRGKWPEVEDYLGINMVATFEAEGIDVLPVTGRIMQRAGAMDWSHRDPFDRMIVVTALERGIPVVSKDATLDGVVDPAFRRIW